ncbi:STAS domain-containing protein [Streptomyces sp. MC1]|uniref:STAS domain-containing protein n=1 Tax=Streptomyces sp. MC1 TaxID=295105 RepID=UPI0018CAFEE3|nr:STAS domain-containing protein [Streptomyces sp. MC1]
MFQSHRPLVVEVPGEIDLLPAPPLEGSLRRHIARGWPLDVGLDGVTFMEARVISVLLRLDTGVSGRHGRLRVRRADPARGRLFSLTRTDRRLDLLPRPAGHRREPGSGSGAGTAWSTDGTSRADESPYRGRPVPDPAQGGVRRVVVVS